MVLLVKSFVPDIFFRNRKQLFYCMHLPTLMQKIQMRVFPAETFETYIACRENCIAQSDKTLFPARCRCQILFHGDIKDLL